MKDYSVPSSGYNPRPFIKNITLDQQLNQKRRSIDSNNKTFFSNIKAQLNSIRTDVTKLVGKESVKPININRSYNGNAMSSAQKLELSNGGYPTEAKLQKKISNQSNEKTYPSVTTSIHLQNTTNAKYQSKISQMEIKLSQQTKKYQQMKYQFEEQRKNQLFLRDQIQKYKEHCQKQQQKIHMQEVEIRNWQQRFQIFNKDKQEDTILISRLQSQLKKPQIVQQKVTVPDPQLNRKIFQHQNIINSLKQKIKRLEQDNQTLKVNASNYQSNKQIQIASICKNYEDKLNRVEAKSFKQLGTGFQVKINQLLDQNYGLKNKINQLQSQIDQDKIQIQSLQSTIEAYELRDKEVGKGVSQIQNQNLRDELMQLHQKMDKIQSDHQFEIMKLQNQIDQLRSNPNKQGNDNKSFNQILKDQIAQIQNLKQKLRQKNQIINKLKR